LENGGGDGFVWGGGDYKRVEVLNCIHRPKKRLSENEEGCGGRSCRFVVLFVASFPLFETPLHSYMWQPPYPLIPQMLLGLFYVDFWWIGFEFGLIFDD